MGSIKRRTPHSSPKPWYMPRVTTGSAVEMQKFCDFCVQCVSMRHGLPFVTEYSCHPLPPSRSPCLYQQHWPGIGKKPSGSEVLGWTSLNKEHMDQNDQIVFHAVWICWTWHSGGREPSHLQLQVPLDSFLDRANWNTPVCKLEAILAMTLLCPAPSPPQSMDKLFNSGHPETMAIQDLSQNTAVGVQRKTLGLRHPTKSLCKRRTCPLHRGLLHTWVRPNRNICSTYAVCEMSGVSMSFNEFHWVLWILTVSGLTQSKTSANKWEKQIWQRR